VSLVSSANPGQPDLDIFSLLKRYHLRPDPRLGQNFLVDRVALRRVVEAAEIAGEDVVLEIGAGLGNLTRYLAEDAAQVIAVELDKRLIPPLQETLSGYANVTIEQGDILAMNPARLIGSAKPPDSGYLVVANIPYYITSALLRHLLEATIRPARMVLTVQKEVAERICASPGEMSILALSVQVYGNPVITSYIPAGAFYPVPKVDSAIVRVAIEPSPKVPAAMLDSFFRLVKAGFSQKRKTLRNALSGGMRWSPQQAEDVLLQAGIQPNRRAQTVSLEEWSTLTEIALRMNS
jgi:16S rRNA (adenine1518-N6/adenine1519-N6)-dimethyltransferase